MATSASARATSAPSSSSREKRVEAWYFIQKP
jgi:hypothetical protein